MQVRVIRSPQRRKTVTATIQGGVLVVRVPEGMTRRDEEDWVQKMRERLEKRAAKRRLDTGSDLTRRAEALNRAYFGGRLRYTIRWVTNQSTRWGSCSPSDQTIRLSHELAPLPRFVLDYVIVHELAHLIRPDHSPAFWELVHRYPQTERAIGFLMGFAHAKNLDSPCGLPPRQPVPLDSAPDPAP